MIKITKRGERERIYARIYKKYRQVGLKKKKRRHKVERGRKKQNERKKEREAKREIFNIKKQKKIFFLQKKFQSVSLSLADNTGTRAQTAAQVVTDLLFLKSKMLQSANERRKMATRNDVGGERRRRMMMTRKREMMTPMRLAKKERERERKKRQCWRRNYPTVEHIETRELSKKLGERET